MEREKTENIFISNIQRFSLHDGPGIRTTIFLKGCLLRCPWCSNPENLLGIPQRYIKDGKVGIYGKKVSSWQLFNEIIKDQAFYTGELEKYDISDDKELDKLPGGVTFSGGECLLQMAQMRSLLQKLKEIHVHMAVETSLFSPEDMLNIAIEYIDLFYVDLKILNDMECHRIINGDIEIFKTNLKILLASGKPVIFRIPIIGGFTDTTINRDEIIEFLTTLYGNIIKIELIKEHNLGIPKYISLIDGGNDVVLPDYQGVSDHFIQEYKKLIENKIKKPVEICTL